jgi:hypothetical protein
MQRLNPLLIVLTLLTTLASAQFDFFSQMFGGGGQEQQQQQQRQPQNVASDPSHYQQQWDSFSCDHYLCPDTLGRNTPADLCTTVANIGPACVHFPHHCPCPFPLQQDKFELVDGNRICVSKGGFKAGEAARKVELARKGKL